MSFGPSIWVIAEAYAWRFDPHRFAAAFLAMSLRSLAVNAFALALPPFDAPSFDNATAAGFLVSGGSGGALPVAMSATRFAICVKSSRLLAREGIAPD